MQMEAPNMGPKLRVPADTRQSVEATRTYVNLHTIKVLGSKVEESFGLYLAARKPEIEEVLSIAVGDVVRYSVQEFGWKGL